MIGKGVEILNEEKKNDAAAKKYICDSGFLKAKCVQYKLEYAMPYQNFTGIAGFERLTRYHPFCDSLDKDAVAVIDLSEWIGHEQEEYLEVFCKYLHDYNWGFYRFSYVFTVGAADKYRIMALYRLLSSYLEEGRIVEDNTMTDEGAMQEYLMKEYPVNRALAKKLAHIFVSSKIKGYALLKTVMDDFTWRMKGPKACMITEGQVKKSFRKLGDSKFCILFQKAAEDWRKECIGPQAAREEAV